MVLVTRVRELDLKIVVGKRTYIIFIVYLDNKYSSVHWGGKRLIKPVDCETLRQSGHFSGIKIFDANVKF